MTDKADFKALHDFKRLHEIITDRLRANEGDPDFNLTVSVESARTLLLALEIAAERRAQVKALQAQLAALNEFHDMPRLEDSAEISMLKAQLAAKERELEETVAVAHKHGWNGVENSKFLWKFFDDEINFLRRAASNEP